MQVFALGTLLLGHTTGLFEDTMRSRPHTLFTIEISTAGRDQAADVNGGDRGTSLGHCHTCGTPSSFNRARALCTTATSLQQARGLSMWTCMVRPRVNHTPSHDLQASKRRRRGREAHGCVREVRWRLERVRTRLLVPRWGRLGCLITWAPRSGSMYRLLRIKYCLHLFP